MPTKKDSSGHRSLAMEFEVPGTPEQVWHAIATGPGITAWFVPSAVEERQGGAVSFNLGPGMSSSGHVTGWEPPRRFAYEEPGWSGDAPPLATEFTIQARAGGTCVVRIVHSLFTSDEKWDDQIDGMETGWGAFFNVLRVYLAHFAGLPASSVRVMGTYRGTEADAWQELTKAAGLGDLTTGQRVTTGNDAPRFGGVVHADRSGEHHNELTLRLDVPARGAALLGTFAWGGQVHVALSFYFYGEDAAGVAKQAEQQWQAWMSRRFPMAAPA